MKNLLISFSGGKTSALMCAFILANPKYKEYNKLFVFANTSKENEETLLFVDQCDKYFNLNLHWVEAKVIHQKNKGTFYTKTDFKSAKRKGEIFEEVIKKYGIPSKYYRHCTRELKEIPIHKMAKDYFMNESYLTAIGIRSDEKHRLSSTAEKKGFVYPLCESGIDKKTVTDYWSKMPFSLDLKEHEGNCDLCPLKSVRKKMTILKNNPEKGVWWGSMEQLYATDQQSKFSAHQSITIPELYKQSKKPFTQYRESNQLSLWDNSLDLEYDCFCKAN